MPLIMISLPREDKIFFMIVSKFSRGYLQKTRHLSSRNISRSKNSQFAAEKAYRSFWETAALK